MLTFKDCKRSSFKGNNLGNSINKYVIQILRKSTNITKILKIPFSFHNFKTRKFYISNTLITIKAC